MPGATLQVFLKLVNAHRQALITAISLIYTVTLM
jgi:hypothetical protein